MTDDAERVLDEAAGDPPPAFLTVEEAGALLRVGRTTAYLMAKNGTLPGLVRVGSQLRVRRVEFLRAYGLDPSDF